MKKLLIPMLLMILILSACGASATPLPTVELVPATSTFPPPTQTSLPTETIFPTAEIIATAEVPPTENITSNISFTNQVLPIFQAKCVECHGGRQTKEGFNITSFDGLMAGSFDGAVVFPGNANDSLLVQLVAAGEMPNRGPAVTGEELQMIIDWINQGAVNN